MYVRIVVRRKRRVPAAARGRPHCSAEAGPRRSLWAVPEGAGGGGAPPSEGWAALSGEQEEESRRSMDGGEPAGPDNIWGSIINKLINQLSVPDLRLSRQYKLDTSCSDRTGHFLY